MSELYYESAYSLSSRLRAGEISSEAVTEAVIQRYHEVESRIRAFLSVDESDALAQARASDRRRADGEALGPLDGIPVSLKDIIAVAGQPLTCASKILESFVSPYDATVTRRLKEAGSVIWGRLNMDEFAMGSSTENSAFQTTRNPWDTSRVPGGSSGGSAASVAAGESVLALGSDTGGSIRQPAAHCGVVGLKPTYGLVSRYGLVAFASSLDQIGPVGRSVEDVAMLLQVIAGHDPLDSTSFQTSIPDFLESLRGESDPWKLGVPQEYLGEGLDGQVRESVRSAIQFYADDVGCEIREISLPLTDLAVPVYYIIATAEASSNLARYDGVRYGYRSENVNDHLDLYFRSRGEGFGAEVKRRIILGTYALSSGYYDAYYLRAQKVRTLIRKGFLEAFAGVDAIISPVAPTPAFLIGERLSDPLSMYLSDIYTLSVNLSGLPAISIPGGFSREGLPIGIQLIGKPFEEGRLLAMAYRFEQDHPYSRMRPGI